MFIGITALELNNEEMPENQVCCAFAHSGSVCPSTKTSRRQSVIHSGSPFLCEIARDDISFKPMGRFDSNSV
jgi:hypothetical protein